MRKMKKIRKLPGRRPRSKTVTTVRKVGRKLADDLIKAMENEE